MLTARPDVTRIMLLSAKGGCGKTTLSTNLTHYYAAQGEAPLLVDFDAQGSSSRWAAQREDSEPPVQCITAHRSPTGMTRSWQMRVPEGTHRVVIDTPAAVRGAQLQELLRLADVVLVPVLPSDIDIHALSSFLHELVLHGKVRSLPVRVGIVANRVRRHTDLFDALQRFLHRLDFPFVGQLRETMNYPRVAEMGVGIHALPRGRTGRDRAEWQAILDWIEASPGRHARDSERYLQSA